MPALHASIFLIGLPAAAAACHDLSQPPILSLWLVFCCRRALRGVVARAQSANDERLLANPYLQLRAMLDMGRVQLEQL
jgi:hypothetical protein